MWIEIILVCVLTAVFFISYLIGILYNALNGYLILSCIGMTAITLFKFFTHQFGFEYWSNNLTLLGRLYWLDCAIKATYFSLIFIYIWLRLPEHSFNAQQRKVIKGLMVTLPLSIGILMGLPSEEVNWPQFIFMSIFSLFLVYELLRYQRINFDNAVILLSPFKQDAIVLQGGASSLFNHHFNITQQRWALDIELFEEDMSISTTSMKTLEDFNSFAKPLFAPLSGEVIALATDHADMPLGQSDLDNLAGNYIIIKHGDKFLMLSHLKQHSCKLQRGDIVIEGQTLIGECGNSGNSTHPHLHMQVQNHANFDQVTQTYPMYFKTQSGTALFKRANDIIAV
ncbi:hypothetical protein CWB96_19785 [Pseudoalteromonas citrea]|uniref:M23ase beta-sheet core domain-containing protein n=1 Tax=Pseudoalteromonas citrea TaxID=43655 RepID=A0A5S3XJ11_9GAMM|nr:M23 family metallopeptidase [Pseudoalteromonas citrea]TMP40799.1 hypothetical protein CWB97_16930 [Pseudoalteromonas citrea]TMP54114.1 hypothetical protein CWB96_19785 [Pseudoalteromonas citrea]